MILRTTKAAIYLAVFISAPIHAAAPVSDATVNTASNAELLERIDELSRVMTIRNKMQFRFQSQLDEIGHEINEIRGSIEVFGNQLEQVENRQRNLYQMLDERQQATTVNAPISREPSENDPKDKASYQAAVNLVLNDKEYTKAISAFETFVIEHPKSSYVPNAQYWLGQLLYKDKRREQARAAFLIVTEDHPTSNKRADSLFKIGVIDEYLGVIDSANAFYQQTISEYPDSSAAGLAQKRLNGL